MANKFMTEEIVNDIENTYRHYILERFESMYKVGYPVDEIAITLGLPLSIANDLTAYFTGPIMKGA